VVNPRVSQIKAYDGSIIILSSEVIDHIVRKHPQMFSIVGFDREQIVTSLIRALETPNEVFLDTLGSRHFVMQVDELHLNVIVIGDSVKTAYLIGNRTYARMRKTRWLRRLYSA
jgi:hypothetical protein